jgi:hypothetical protein
MCTKTNQANVTVKYAQLVNELSKVQNYAFLNACALQGHLKTMMVNAKIVLLAIDAPGTPFQMSLVTALLQVARHKPAGRVYIALQGPAITTSSLSQVVTG